MTTPTRRLRVLPEFFRVELLADRTASVDSCYAMVRGPEGLTVIRQVPSGTDGSDVWIGLYGDDAHDLDLPGMLAAVVGPLGANGIPVFVASTFHSDLVLVPRHRFTEAVACLRDAGHEVSDVP